MSDRIDYITDHLTQRALCQVGLGTWNGTGPTPYFDMCRQVSSELGLMLIYTRDTGYHSSGWWKNPDYERCFHLSLSFHDPQTKSPAPRDAKITEILIDKIFGRNKSLIWSEPPHSPNGKALDVWHYRLFCDPHWRAIKPRGEVYNTELTEAGWKSFSDVQAQLNAEKAMAISKILNSR